MQTRAKTWSQTAEANDVDMAEVATPEHIHCVPVFSSQASTVVQSETGRPTYSSEVKFTPGTGIDNSPSSAVSNFNMSTKGSEESSGGSTPTTAAAPLPTQQHSLVVILTFRDQIIAKGVIDIRAAKSKGKRLFKEDDDFGGEMPQQSTKHQKVDPNITTFEEIHKDNVFSFTIQTGVVANSAVNSNIGLNKKEEFVTEETLESILSKTEEIELQSLTPAGSQIETPPASESDNVGDADAETPCQDKTDYSKEMPAAADEKHSAAADKKHTAGKTSIAVERNIGRTYTTLRRRTVIEKVVAVENPAPQAIAPQAAAGRTKNIVRVVPPPEGWTNKMRHKLGYSGMEAALGPGPGTKMFWIVFNKLRDHHAKTGKPIDFSRNGTGAPLHAAGGMTVDTPVQVMLSQATANPNALNAIKRMRQVYVVKNQNGEKGSEKALPNYHLIRTCEEAQLRKVIILAGLFNKRAKAIQDFLNMVYERNFAKLSAEEKLTICKGNPPEATEFVPGLLSLDYLNDFNTDQALYDHILSWPLFGIKSACCVLAFGLGKKVFAVDTHVHRLAILLGWIPAGLSPENACKYLDALVPDELKYSFHQACWWHARECVKCQAGTTPATRNWDKCVCPLEEYMKRGNISKKRPTKNKSSSSSPAFESSAKKIVKKEVTLMPYAKMTPEEAEQKGYELFEADQVNDDFGTDHGNLQGGGVQHWIKKMLEMDSEVASATIETKTKSITTVKTINADPEDPAVDTASTKMDD